MAKNLLQVRIGIITRGTIETSIAIQKAFKAYGGDKMNHTSMIFMRSAPNKPWVRLEGFASPDTVIHEYTTMLRN
jgi:protein SCO1